MERYNVSRDTIRKSLDLLEGNGFLALDVDKLDFPIIGVVTFKELSKKMGVNSNTILHELDLIIPDKFLRKKT